MAWCLTKLISESPFCPLKTRTYRRVNNSLSDFPDFGYGFSTDKAQTQLKYVKIVGLKGSQVSFFKACFRIIHKGIDHFILSLVLFSKLTLLSN